MNKTGPLNRPVGLKKRQPENMDEKNRIIISIGPIIRFLFI
jgi:hypothetical protein